MTLWTITSPEPIKHVRVGAHLDVAQQHATARRRAQFAVTLPGTVHEEPAGRRALASVTLTAPKAGLAKTST